MDPKTFTKKFPNTHQTYEQREEQFQSPRVRNARVKTLETEGYNVRRGSWLYNGERLWWLKAVKEENK